MEKKCSKSSNKKKPTKKPKPSVYVDPVIKRKLEDSQHKQKDNKSTPVKNTNIEQPSTSSNQSQRRYLEIRDIVIQPNMKYDSQSFMAARVRKLAEERKKFILWKTQLMKPNTRPTNMKEFQKPQIDDNPYHYQQQQ